MINGVHHVAISTPDIQRLEYFYRQIGFEKVVDLGWEKGSDVADKIADLKGSSAKVVMLRLANCFLELFEYMTPLPKPSEQNIPVCDHGITHLCLDVTDIDAEYGRLLELGMIFHCPPQDVGPGVRSTYGRDPDGNVVELLEVLEKPHPIEL